MSGLLFLSLSLLAHSAGAANFNYPKAEAVVHRAAIAQSLNQEDKHIAGLYTLLSAKAPDAGSVPAPQPGEVVIPDLVAKKVLLDQIAKIEEHPIYSISVEKSELGKYSDVDGNRWAEYVSTVIIDHSDKYQYSCEVAATVAEDMKLAHAWSVTKSQAKCKSL